MTVREARKNGGISEPEHKLKLFVIPSFFLPIGFMMMGLGVYYQAHYMVFVVGLGVMNVAGPFGSLLALTYAFDCFHMIEPKEKSGVQSSAQDSAPYLIAIVAISMSIAFAFVSPHSHSLLVTRGR
jgi:hypothetical protein